LYFEGAFWKSGGPDFGLLEGVGATGLLEVPNADDPNVEDAPNAEVMFELAPNADLAPPPNGELEAPNADPALLFPNAETVAVGAPNEEAVVEGCEPNAETVGCGASAPNAEVAAGVVEGWAPNADVVGCCASAPNADGAPNVDPPFPNVDGVDEEPKAGGWLFWAAAPKADGGLLWATVAKGEVEDVPGVEVWPNTDPPPVLFAAAKPNAEVCCPAKAENPPLDDPVPKAVAGFMRDDCPNAGAAAAGFPNVDVADAGWPKEDVVVFDWGCPNADIVVAAGWSWPNALDWPNAELVPPLKAGPALALARAPNAEGWPNADVPAVGPKALVPPAPKADPVLPEPNADGVVLLAPNAIEPKALEVAGGFDSAEFVFCAAWS
jgi:hypothetical protein